MKKLFCLLLLVVISLSMAACGDGNHVEGIAGGEVSGSVSENHLVPPVSYVPPSVETQRPGKEDYTLRELVVEDSTEDEKDGRVVAHYSHQLFLMEATDETNLEMVKRAEAFNARTEELKQSLEEAGLVLGQDALFAGEYGYDGPAYTSETVTTASVMGDVISLKMNGYGYTGGAHPNVWTSSAVFDLFLGVYIDPIEVADDPDLFRATVTDQLLDQIDGLEEEIRMGYFTGYEEVVSRWNEYCAVFLEDGLEVTFSTYELGPYALGSQVFHLPYEALREVIGENGLARLGLAEFPVA